MCDHNCAIVPPLLLEYYEAKVQMLSVFSWKAALNLIYIKHGTRYLRFSRIHRFSLTDNHLSR